MDYMSCINNVYCCCDCFEYKDQLISILMLASLSICLHLVFR